jgi:hypothetical protein
MDIVLIPAYMRPEYLSLCLEYLSRADGAREDKEYWICQDMREHDEHRYGIQLRWTKEVLDNSPLPVRYIKRQPHTYAGNSYNTLEAYKEAYERTDARRVYLVEEDVLVTPDFFRWHEAVQAQEPEAMCSVAYRCKRNGEARTDITDSGAYFTSARDYASVGPSWRRERLKPVVAHATPAYYGNPGGYLDHRFPGDIYSGWYHEQDGLIMRVMHEEKAIVAWGYAPRCYHIGNVGYHRPSGKRGDGQLKEKIAFVRGWIHDRERIKEVAPDFGDIEPYDASLNVPFSEMHKEQHFA